MPTVDYSINTSLYQSNGSSCWFAAYRILFDWKGRFFMGIFYMSLPIMSGGVSLQFSLRWAKDTEEVRRQHTAGLVRQERRPT